MKMLSCLYSGELAFLESRRLMGKYAKEASRLRQPI